MFDSKKLISILDKNEKILLQIPVIDYIKYQQNLKKNKEELAALLIKQLYLVVTSNFIR